MSREAMQMALEALEILTDGYDGTEVGIEIDAMTALRQALETEQQPVANEVQLNIIRYWPEGFADRLEHVWEDLIGFIPNYKLYDLQKMLAEFGFTMVLYEGNRPPAHEWVGLTDEEIDDLLPEADGTTKKLKRKLEYRPGLWGDEVGVDDAWSKSLVIEIIRAVEKHHGIGEKA